MGKKEGQYIAIAVNGEYADRDFHRGILDKAAVIICADGGANTVEELGIAPDYVIGDMDSIRKEVLDRLKILGRTVIIEDPDQNKTDLELAIELAAKLKPREIIILGALGKNIDHTLASIISLDKIGSGIIAKITDGKNEIRLARESIEIEGEAGDIVSVVALTEVSGLTYEGLKWNVQGMKAEFGWFGVRNRMTGRKASIKLQQGKILVIKVRD